MTPPTSTATRRNSTGRAVTLAIIGALGLAACGGSDASPAPATPVFGAAADTTTAPEAATGATISLSSSRYTPDQVSVAVGQPVVFTNEDPYEHTVTSAKSSSVSFDSGKFGEAKTFTVTFDAPGTYAFFCQIHPTMQGTITVS